MENYDSELQICPCCGYIEGTPPEEAIHIDPGTLLYDRYIVGKVIGYGGFGVTYIGWDGKLEQKVAIKEYLPSEFSTRVPGATVVTIFEGEKREQFSSGLKKFVEEARHLAKFQSEDGIVKVFDSFEENDTAYIIMEYLSGETLKDYLAREKVIEENKAVEMLMPVMQSLKAVHSEGLLHRDIAPDNIFITDSGEVKLIDFGASRYATTSYSRSLTVVIKPGYSPEEQYRSRGDQGAYTDVYAVAATLYKMITGVTPPDAMERRAKAEGQKKEILEEPHKLNKNISINRENAILNAMNIRIEDRTPDIATFVKELEADPPAKRIYGAIKKVDLFNWPLWLKILVPTLLCGVLIFGGLLLTGVIDFKSSYDNEVKVPDGMVAVPGVEGYTLEEAIERLEEEGLTPLAKEKVKSEYVPVGQVVYQSPDGNMVVVPNTIVELTVSDGTGKVEGAQDGQATVPYVVLDTEADAVDKLTQAGLKAEISYEYTDTEKGLVASQSITAGVKVDEGTTVKIVVSLGLEKIEVPDVLGKTEAQAKKLLEEAGFVVVTKEGQSRDAKKGEVIAQSVDGGDMATPGSEITITVAAEDGKTTTTTTTTKKPETTTTTTTKKPETTTTTTTTTKKTTTTTTTTAKICTITFFPKGGEMSKTTMTVPYGSTFGRLPKPTKENFTFDAWYFEETGGMTASETDVVYHDYFLIAHWIPNSYMVSWNSSNQYSVTVERTSSPYGYGAVGILSNGDKIYYGDELSISYTAKTGYTISSKGKTSITVSGDVTSSDIYASCTVKSYTYDIVYKSTNGTTLGTSSATKDYGTTNTISAKSFSGYTTPSSQSVKWDSSSKTITFLYTPSNVSSTSISGNFISSPPITYTTTMEYRNRTATSVDVRLTTTVKIGAWTGFAHGVAYKATCGSVNSVVQVAGYRGLSTSGASRTASSNWMTIPLNTTNATSVSFSVYMYQSNYYNQDVSNYDGGWPNNSYTWTMNIPAY